MHTSEHRTIKPRRRIGEALIEERLITADQLQEGLRYQQNVKKLIGATLVDMGFLSDAALHAFLQSEMEALRHAEALDEGQAAPAATREELSKLVGRAITDGAFRARLMEDPERAARLLREAGVRLLSSEELFARAGA